MITNTLLIRHCIFGSNTPEVILRIKVVKVSLANYIFGKVLDFRSRGVFRTMSNVYEGIFCENSLRSIIHILQAPKYAFVKVLPNKNFNSDFCQENPNFLQIAILLNKCEKLNPQCKLAVLLVQLVYLMHFKGK